MLTTFHALKEIYASREITMDDLEVMQQYDFIRFENRGISRSETDCLLCEVHCMPLEGLLESLKTTVFDSIQNVRRSIAHSGLNLIEHIDGALYTFQSEDKQIEILATKHENGTVHIDIDDIEAEPLFQVYLRVQH
jgi:hypothetical protein